MSRTKNESIANKFYLGQFGLKHLYGSLTLPQDIDCWAEFGSATKNDFLFFPKKVKLNFINIFLSLGQISCGDGYSMAYQLQEEQKWETTNCIQEPNHGFYIQLSDNENKDSLKIKIKKAADSSVYLLVKL